MDHNEEKTIDRETAEIYAMFFNGTPVSAHLIDTGIGEDDFRKTVIVTDDNGNRHILKIASNDFTFPEKIRMWQRTVEEYRKLGYYCPKIYCDKNGEFPWVEYMGHRCVAFGEEFSKYRLMEDRESAVSDSQSGLRLFPQELWTMTARIAALKLDYTDFPSGYCLFETFCPSDKTDEVLECALEWKEYAERLPERFSRQVNRIWDLWIANREKLEKIYRSLPTSVFQADLNSTNLLVDDEGRFAGMIDFNISGKDVFLNYLMRENYGSFEKELEMIRNALSIAREHYTFSEQEKEAAPLIYRCLKPVWSIRLFDLQDAGEDEQKIRECLDQSEYCLRADIDFRSFME
ncbi:MAG: phosphotransferase [Erysipelotrichaceae bacterium]|nr:phosphotransferase [Erysipelotrichaceae bacterium]